jgi:hypothetical protein
MLLIFDLRLASDSGSKRLVHTTEPSGLREHHMQDILKTLTSAEVSAARRVSVCGDQQDEHTVDCYQIVRYSNGQIFHREEAERALRKIRAE